MNRFLSFFTAPILAFAFVSGVAIAGPGHDHGDEAPAVATGPASPRFDAHTDLFEAVGILEGNELAVFVDHFDTNEPILNAKVELESGSINATGEFHEEHGAYSFAAAPFKEPGNYPITLTVTAGEDVDILAGNLVVADAHADHEEDEASSHLFERPELWILGLAVLIALIWAVRRVQKRRTAGGLK